MTCPVRADGEAAGVRWVHVVPSHSQVSPKGPLVSDWPPNMTITRRRASYAIAVESRGGGEVAPVRSVQVVPSHVHVSPTRVPPIPPPTKPPNSTTLPRAASYAIAWKL